MTPFLIKLCIATILSLGLFAVYTVVKIKSDFNSHSKRMDGAFNGTEQTYYNQ